MPGILPAAAKPLAKPRKRPSQARSRFTVAAIFDAYVRIWQRQGPGRVGMRQIAEEAGFAVGTVYAYFPNLAALHSGYIRDALDRLLRRIDAEIVAPPGLAWRGRLNLLLALCFDPAPATRFIDAEMFARANAVAEPKHHARVFAELRAAWCAVFDACTDMPQRPEPARVEALLLMVWGAKRYMLRLDDGAAADQARGAQIKALFWQALAVPAGDAASSGKGQG